MVYKATYRIRFGDVDHAGVAFYPRLVAYCHLAYEDYFAEELGVPFHEQFIRHRWGSPVVSLNAEFHSPLRHGDIFHIEVHVDRIGKRSVTLLYKLVNETTNTHASDITVTHCYVDMNSFDSIDIPAPLREALEAYVERVQSCASSPS